MHITYIAGLAVYFSIKWMLYFALENHRKNMQVWLLDGGVLVFFSVQLFFQFGVSSAVPLWAAYVGIFLFIAGIICASYSRLVLAENYRATTVMETPGRLVTRGFYRIIRNPIYTGTLLMGCGIELSFFSPFFFLNGAGFFLFLWRIQKEEKILREAFPEEWRAFIRSTPYRLIPFIY